MSQFWDDMKEEGFSNIGEGFGKIFDGIRHILPGFLGGGYTDDEAEKIRDDWNKVIDPKPNNGDGLIIGNNPAIGDYSGMSSIVILVLIMLFIFKK